MKTAFFSMNQEQEYRDTSERNARSMPALFSQTFTCNSEVREEGEPYKINNVYSASCARLFEHLNPQHAGHFETRKRRVAA